MRIGAILGVLAVTATALAAVPARADKLDDLGRYGKDFKKAIALADRHDTAGAIRAYQRLIEQHTDVPIPYYFLANLYWDAGQKDRAREQFAKAAKGDLDQAIATLQTALGTVTAKSLEAASLRDNLAEFYDRKHDTQAAARERSLAQARRREFERADREAERAHWRVAAPLSVCVALFGVAAVQLALAILFALVALIVGLAGGRGPHGAPARKVRWSFADVIVTYLVAFLPPLLVIPTFAVAADFVHPGIFDEWSFSIPMGFALLGTAALAFLRIRRRLERKARGGEEAVAPVAPPQRRWAIAAMSGWLLLTVVIVNGIVLFATGLIIAAAMAALGALSSMR